ncbi:MAG: guanylate kinase [Gammaproteobacteria bacterium]
MNVGTLYIIAAPSGGGKSSLVSALIKILPRLKVSVSHTTRPMRPGEQNGVQYHFVEQAIFDALLRENTFLEHAQVFDHCYGTSRDWVLEQLQKGLDVILEIDWQGARQVRHLLPQSVGIFILPPSRTQLGERLHARAQDPDNVIARRMHGAITELKHYDEFDYLVLNDDFDTALADLQSIIRCRQLRTSVQIVKLKDLLASLLV